MLKCKSCFYLLQLQEKLREKDVSLTGTEVIQQSLGDGGAVLQEAEDCHEHLHDLQGGNLRAGASLHVLNAHRHAALVVEVGYDWLGEGVSGDCQQNIRAGLPPDIVVLRTDRTDGREEKVEVVLPSQLLHCSLVSAESQ